MMAYWSASDSTGAGWWTTAWCGLPAQESEKARKARVNNRRNWPHAEALHSSRPRHVPGARLTGRG